MTLLTEDPVSNPFSDIDELRDRLAESEKQIVRLWKIVDLCVWSLNTMVSSQNEVVGIVRSQGVALDQIAQKLL